MSLSSILQVHSASGYDLSSYDNAAYRPETRQSTQTGGVGGVVGGGINPADASGIWPASGQGHDLSSLGRGPPGYLPKSAGQQQPQVGSSQRPDSVADMKRELKERLAGSNRGSRISPQDSGGEDDLNTTGTTSDASSDPQADRGTGEYQTMDSHKGPYETFRPSPTTPAGAVPSAGRSPFGSRALPETPSETIPSVPGYARPFATPTGTAQRPFQPPPSPPRSRPPAAAAAAASAARSRRPLLETSLDDNFDNADNGPPHPPRTRSAGHILETNLDDDDDGVDSGGEGNETRPALPNSNGHSLSLGETGFPRLSLGAAAPMLETDM